MRLVVAIGIALMSAPLGALLGQCPEGTPPPCGSTRRPATRVTPPSASVRARHIMLLPFRNVTRAPANDWLVAGAPLLLGEILGQYDELRVVSEARLTAAMRRIGLATDMPPDELQLRRLAEETGGWTWITGNVVLSGNTLRISAQAFDAVTSRVIGRGSSEVPAGADVREAFDRLTLQLLQPAGIRAGRPDVVALTTKSLDAYRSYVEGMSMMQRGAYRRAELAFSDAVRRDSNFAMAWVKLASAAVYARGWTELMNPIGFTGQAIERAARSASLLPPRTAVAIRALQALFHGEMARSHQLADSLVRTDPEDVDAKQWLAMIALFDSRIDPATGSRMGSLTESVAMSKGVLDRDPGRQEAYVVPATIYGFGAGFLGSIVAGRRRPLPSLAAELLVAPDVNFVVVVEDSILTVADSVYRQWPAARRVAAQRRAVEGGLGWVQRWMAANPQDAEAHLWASRFEELRADYRKSLEAMNRAVAIGVESNIENLRPRRMFLYEKTGRFSDAEAIADSLVQSGSLRSRPFNSWIDRGRVWVPAVLLRSRQWDKVAALGRSFVDGVAKDPCDALMREMTSNSVSVDTATLRAVADTAAYHFGALLGSRLSNCADMFARGFVFDSASGDRPRAADRLLIAADSMRTAGNSMGAYRAARTAAAVDVNRKPVLQATPWIDSVSRTVEAGAYFEPGEVVVEGDSLQVTYRLRDREPVIIDPAGLVFIRFFTATISSVSATDTGTFRVRLMHTGIASGSARHGTLEAFGATMNERSAVMTFRGAGAQPSLNGTVDVRTGPGILRAIVRGPVIQELQRRRPASATVTAACPLSTAGICTTRTVPVVYR